MRGRAVDATPRPRSRRRRCHRDETPRRDPRRFPPPGPPRLFTRRSTRGRQRIDQPEERDSAPFPAPHARPRPRPSTTRASSGGTVNGSDGEPSATSCSGTYAGPARVARISIQARAGTSSPASQSTPGATGVACVRGTTAVSRRTPGIRSEEDEHWMRKGYADTAPDRRHVGHNQQPAPCRGSAGSAQRHEPRPSTRPDSRAAEQHAGVAQRSAPSRSRDDRPSENNAAIQPAGSPEPTTTRTPPRRRPARTAATAIVRRQRRSRARSRRAAGHQNRTVEEIGPVGPLEPHRAHDGRAPPGSYAFLPGDRHPPPILTGDRGVLPSVNRYANDFRRDVGVGHRGDAPDLAAPPGARRIAITRAPAIARPA